MGFFTSDNVWVKAQTSRGTAVTPDINIPFVSGEWTFEPTFFKSEVVGADRSSGANRLGYYQYRIKIKCHFSAKGHDLLMKYHYGKYAFAADVTETNENSHTHKMADAAAEFTSMFTTGFTLEGGGVDKYYTFIDCAVNSYKLVSPMPGILTVEYDIVATDKTESASSSASGTAVSPLVLFDNFQLTFACGVAGSEVTQSYRDFTYESNRGLTPENDNTVKTALSWEYADVFEQKFGFVVNTGAAGRSAINTDFLNATNRSAIITMTSDQLITGAATKTYRSIIDIPNFNYIGMTPITENGIRRERYDCELAVVSAGTPFSLVNYNENATL